MQVQCSVGDVILFFGTLNAEDLRFLTGLHVQDPLKHVLAGKSAMIFGFLRFPTWHAHAWLLRFVSPGSCSSIRTPHAENYA